MKTEVLSLLEGLIETGQLLIESFQECDDAYAASPYLSNASEAELRAFVISAFAAIEQIADKDSLYYKNTPHDSVPL